MFTEPLKKLGSRSASVTRDSLVAAKGRGGSKEVRQREDKGDGIKKFPVYINAAYGIF